VGVVISLSFLALQISKCHSDHGSLLLLDVQELNNPIFEQLLKIDLVSNQLENFTLPYLQLALFDNVKWALYTARVREELDLLLGDVSHNRDLLWKQLMSAHVLNIVDKLRGIAVAAKPVAVNEYFHHIFVLKNLRVQRGKILHALILELVSKDLSRGAH